MLVSALAVGAGLVVLQPSLPAYAGFSGALNGVFVGGALWLAREERRRGARAFLAAIDHPPRKRWGWRALVDPPGEINQLGFRGRRFQYEKDDFVVRLVGDSQVEAKTCVYDLMPERRLEHHLATRIRRPVKVFPLGAGGYGQDQQLLAMEEYLEASLRFRGG